MKSASRKKTTPAIRRATQNLEQALTLLQGYDLSDLQQRVRNNSLADDQKCALTSVLDNLYCLAQAEALRDSGGKQQDMFSGLKEAAFAAHVHPMNQGRLF